MKTCLSLPSTRKLMASGFALMMLIGLCCTIPYLNAQDDGRAADGMAASGEYLNKPSKAKSTKTETKSFTFPNAWKVLR